MHTIDDCVLYFKNTDGFSRLMAGLFDMYVRYERCFGAVRVSRPSPEEEKAISEFFNRDYYDQALIRISLADFERQLQKNFSLDIRLDALLEAYNQRPIIRRTGPRVTINAFAAHVEKDLLPVYAETEAEAWLTEVIAHTRRNYRKWAEEFSREPDKITPVVETVCKLLNDLPFLHNKVEDLPAFAKRHGEDGYAYGINGEYGPLLLRALARRFDVPLPTVPEECAALYFKAGLLTEGALNQVLVRGLQAHREEDSVDAICDLYCKLEEPHMLTLQQISHFSQVQAHNRQVYIIENRPVFTAVNERIDAGNPCTVICIENGLNAAAERLIDLLAADHTKIIYSGDMDYKGLALADSIYLRHPRLFKPWRYGKDEYEKILSDNDFQLPEHKKDQGLHNDDLAALLSHMRKKGKTAPQIALIKELAEDINGGCLF